MRRTAVFLAALLIVAVPVAGMVLQSGADRAAQAQFMELERDLPGLSVMNVRADPWRQSATVEGLTFRRAGLLLRVERINLPFAPPQSPFASPAYAQDAVPGSSTISAENIEIDIGAIYYAIKSIDLSGTSLTKADLDRILDPKSTVSLANRIGKFSASQIAIPEIDMQMTLSDESEKDSYHDIALNDVVNGHVGKATIGSLSSDLTSPEAGSMHATYGPIKMSGLDLPLAARIVSEARKSESEPRGTLYESLEVGTGKILMEKSNLEVDMGALSVKDVKARPLRIPPTSAITLLAAQDADSKRKAKAFIADIVDSFEVSRLDVADVRLTVTDKDAPGTGTLGHISLSQMAHSKIAAVDFETLAVQAQGSSVKIGAVALRDIDLGELRDLAESTAARNSASRSADASIAREISLAGLDVDAGKTPMEGGRRTRFQLGKLDLISADPVDGIPAHFSTVIDHFTLDLKDASGQWDELVALGYDRIDLSSRLEAHFDASKRELGLEDLSLSGIDMGALKIVCNFGNVSKDLFSADQAQVEAAALSILIHRIEIKVENGGLLERLIASAAKRSNKSPDEIREAYVAAAAINVPTLLGDGPAAKTVGNAIAKFIATPKNLRIVAVAPDGLGAADFMLIKDPTALMSKLSIEAAADE
jgi:hypothetical protein